MGRILAIDYGKKRTGIAVTDPLQIIARGLETVPTASLHAWLTNYIESEGVEKVVLGWPTKLDGSETDSTAGVVALEAWFKKKFPSLKLFLWDEQFTSKKAMRVMISGGIKRKKRRDKSLIDQVSATLILQEFLEYEL